MPPSASLYQPVLSSSLLLITPFLPSQPISVITWWAKEGGGQGWREKIKPHSPVCYLKVTSFLPKSIYTALLTPARRLHQEKRIWLGRWAPSLNWNNQRVPKSQLAGVDQCDSPGDKLYSRVDTFPCQTKFTGRKVNSLSGSKIHSTINQKQSQNPL